MTDAVERTVEDLNIRIDRSLCVGFAQCVDESDVAFQLDDDDVVTFANPEKVPRDQLLQAAKVCPVEALIVRDKEGRQLVP